MSGYNDLINTLGGLNEANRTGLVTTINDLQDSQEKKADRNIRVMQGAADAEGSIVLPMQQGRKEQLQMLLDAQKAGNTGRMLDRIIRGAALAGAMFNWGKSCHTQETKDGCRPSKRPLAGGSGVSKREGDSDRAKRIRERMERREQKMEEARASFEDYGKSLYDVSGRQ